MTIDADKEAIHRHRGGLEKQQVNSTSQAQIHRHRGGLEIVCL